MKRLLYLLLLISSFAHGQGYVNLKETQGGAFLYRRLLSTDIPSLNYQLPLVSGSNIKTINGTSLLGSGNLVISTSISDGDKGDITVSGSGSVWTVDTDINKAWTGIHSFAPSITTGDGLAISSSSVTTGNVAAISSSSTAIDNADVLMVLSSGANANSGRTMNGIFSSVINTGSSSTNIAGKFTASGGTTNKAIQIGEGIFEQISTANFASPFKIQQVFGNTSSEVFSLQNNGSTRWNQYNTSNVLTGYVEYQRPGGTPVGIRESDGTNSWDMTMNGTTNIAFYKAGSVSNSRYTFGTGIGVAADATVQIRGGGTSTTTTGLIVEDSGGTDNFVVRDDGQVTARFGVGSGNRLVQSAANGVQSATLTVASSTYTPTLTNTTNVAASTAYVTGYLQIGPTVTVFGKVDIDVTLAASSATELQLSLPVASNFTGEQDAGGNATSDSAASLSARIKADATTDRASIVFKAISLTNDSYSFQFSYQVK